MDWLFPCWATSREMWDKLHNWLSQSFSLLQAALLWRGSCAWGFTWAGWVPTSIPHLMGSRPIARGNSSVPSLLVGLGKGGKARMDSETLGQKHEVGEQRQGYPHSPSPTDPPPHRCSWWISELRCCVWCCSRALGMEAAVLLICGECPKQSWVFLWSWLCSVSLLCHRAGKGWPWAGGCWAPEGLTNSEREWKAAGWGFDSSPVTWGCQGLAAGRVPWAASSELLWVFLSICPFSKPIHRWSIFLAVVFRELSSSPEVEQAKKGFICLYQKLLLSVHLLLFKTTNLNLVLSRALRTV